MDISTGSGGAGSSGPLQFLKNGSSATVTQDTVTPANNIPLPVQLYGVAGTVNITAGDINVQLSDQGANADVTRIGDGTTQLGITVSNEAKVSDATTHTTLSSIDTKTPALASGRVPVDGSGVTQPISATALPLPAGAATSALQTAEATLIGAVTETAPASDTASSGLNGRLQRVAQRLTSLIALLPASLGTKTAAASLSVTPSSDGQFLTTSPTVYAATTWAPGSGHQFLDLDLSSGISSAVVDIQAAIGGGAAFGGAVSFLASVDGTFFNPITGSNIISYDGQLPAQSNSPGSIFNFQVAGFKTLRMDTSGITGANTVAVRMGGSRATNVISQIQATGFVSATVTSSTLPAGAATSALQTAEATLIGAVTETAPATDTASSGLNGRLQRIAQRLTSMIALLPTSLGQKTMANGLAVTLASDQSAIPTSTPQGTLTDKSGTTSGTPLTATTLAAINASRKYLFIQNNSTLGDIYISFTSSATATNSIVLKPYATYEMNGNFVSTELVSVSSNVASATFSAKEG